MHSKRCATTFFSSTGDAVIVWKMTLR